MREDRSRRRPRLSALAVGAGLLAVPPALVAYAALLGLGVHRQGAPWAVSLAATVLLFGPALLAGTAARGRRGSVFGVVLLLWALAVLAGLPVYFPGERREAVATGLALVGWDDGARRMAARLPDEPVVSRPELAEAAAVVEVAPPPAQAIAEHEIALPYEGSGRRLAVPIVFEHGERVIETWMTFDTGATYTTLPLDVLQELGLAPGPDAPSITVQTAGGEREARVVLLDRIWLGNLSIDHVAIATCEACASSETAGLLGLNVTGGYNLFIDGDRREVVFTTRTEHDQRLDIHPFVDLSASFTRFPGGRVEVAVDLVNHAPRPLAEAAAGIVCDGDTWTVPLPPAEPGEHVAAKRRLPSHPGCDGYAVTLDAASW